MSIEKPGFEGNGKEEKEPELDQFNPEQLEARFVEVSSVDDVIRELSRLNEGG